jgi:hypothetical protein
MTFDTSIRDEGNQRQSGLFVEFAMQMSRGFYRDQLQDRPDVGLQEKEVIGSRDVEVEYYPVCLSAPEIMLSETFRSSHEMFS